MTKASSDVPGYFSNPLEGWGNDDLLDNEDARNEACKENPGIFRVLNWEEFRTAFHEHEDPAKKAKAVSRATGVIGVMAAGAGSALLAAAPVLSWPPVSATGFIGLLLTLAGISITAYHVVQYKGRHTWLISRAKAERLRQFYFQYHISNLALACEAVADDVAFEKLKLDRSAELTRVKRKLNAEAKRRQRLIINDHRHEETWFNATWATAQACPAPDTPAYGVLGDFLARLEAQRLQVQLDYTEANLQKSIASAGERHVLLDVAGNVMTALILIAAMVGGWALWTGGDHTVAIALVGVFASLGVTARVLQRGLALRSDVERYDWYLEVIKSSIIRFKTGDEEQKIRTLHDFETHSYSELRQFIRAHRNESFL